MVAEATAILGKYSKTDRGQVPAYVGILEVPEENWGMYGKQVHLEAMQLKSRSETGLGALSTMSALRPGCVKTLVWLES